MKPSQFNVLVDVDPRGTVVHNTESAHSLVVPAPVATWLRTARSKPLPGAFYPGRYRGMLDPLARGGFVVEEHQVRDQRTEGNQQDDGDSQQNPHVYTTSVNFSTWNKATPRPRNIRTAVSLVRLGVVVDVVMRLRLLCLE